MLGTSNTKSKHQGNLAPPKLQRIPKSDGSEPHLRIASKLSKTASIPTSIVQNEKKEGTWFTQTENELRHSYDGTVLKPAQNIATMAGKRYIIVPKNNAMAVQPAITIKPDKIGDKPPILHVDSTTESSNICESQSCLQATTTEELFEKGVTNQDASEASKDGSKENQKDNPIVILDSPKDTSNAMEIDSNQSSENGLVPESSEAISLFEIVPPSKKKLKKSNTKSRKSQNKALINGTSQNSEINSAVQKNYIRMENLKTVDDRTSTAILNIARAGIK